MNLIRNAPFDLSARGGAGIQRALRALLALVLGILVLLGLQTLWLRATARPLRLPTAPVAAYPTAPAAAFAARFALTYETFDPQHADQRARALAGFTASADQAGWDGAGGQTAVQAIPSSIAVVDRHHATVTVAVLTDGAQWRYLAVPVLASDAGGLLVTGTPALVPAPALARPDEAPELPDVDPTLTEQLQASTAAFFRAYGAGNATDLTYYAAPGATFGSGLDGAVDFVSLQNLAVYVGPPAQREARATVRWHDRASGASFDQPYRLEVDLANGKWLVGRLAPGQ